MRSLGFAILLLVLLGSTLSACGATAICLRAEVTLADRVVHLGDIAAIDTDDAALRGPLASLVVGELDDTAASCTIDHRAIGRALRTIGIVPVSVDLYGQRQCQVSTTAAVSVSAPDAVSSTHETSAAIPDASMPPVGNEAPVVSPVGDTLADVLRDRISELLGLPAEHLSIHWRADHQALLDAPADMRRFSVNPRGAINSLGRVQFVVLDRSTADKGHAPSPVTLHGQVSYLTESYVTRRALNAGTVLTESDIEPISRCVDDLWDVGIEDPALLIGTRLVRSAAAKTVLLPSMLAKPIVVQKNQDILVITQVGSVRISMNGVARSDGSVGDIIAINCGPDAPNVYGRITPQGHAVVDPDPADVPVKRSSQRNLQVSRLESKGTW